MAFASVSCSCSTRTIPEMPGPIRSLLSANVVIPITSPRELKSGPPEFPGLMLMSEMMARCSSLLTIPTVRIFRRFSGLPIVNTLSPSMASGWPNEACARGATIAPGRLALFTNRTATSFRDQPQGAPRRLCGRHRFGRQCTPRVQQRAGSSPQDRVHRQRIQCHGRTRSTL